MNNSARLFFVGLFIIAVYFLIAVSIKYYVDLVINWNIIWIIFVTILTFVIPRIIFNSAITYQDIQKCTSNKMDLQPIIHNSNCCLSVFYVYAA